MRVPRTLLRHTITVEPYLGESGTGPLYGAPVQVRCHLAPARVDVARSVEGDRTRRGGTVAILDLEHVDLVTVEARVTVHGRVVDVVRVARQEFPGGPTPDHLEVQFT